MLETWAPASSLIHLKLVLKTGTLLALVTSTYSDYLCCDLIPSTFFFSDMVLFLFLYLVVRFD